MEDTSYAFLSPRYADVPVIEANGGLYAHISAPPLDDEPQPTSVAPKPIKYTQSPIQLNSFQQEARRTNNIMELLNGVTLNEFVNLDPTLDSQPMLVQKSLFEKNWDLVQFCERYPNVTIFEMARQLQVDNAWLIKYAPEAYVNNRLTADEIIALGLAFSTIYSKNWTWDLFIDMHGKPSIDSLNSLVFNDTQIQILSKHFNWNANAFNKAYGNNHDLISCELYFQTS